MNYKKYLENNYAKKLAQAEQKEYYNGYLKENISVYEGDMELMKKHHKFIKYMYSTFAKYVIHRNIIIYYYNEEKCSISVLNKSVSISRTSLKKIIYDSIEEGWLCTNIDKSNKRQILVLPTKLRIKFWKIYAKNKYLNEKDSMLNQVREKLIQYELIENDKMIIKDQDYKNKKI